MWYLLPGNMLAIHGLVFYASLLTGLLTAETANIWSTALRLHSILTILTLMLALLIMPRATVFSETTGGKK